ncbi:MAG: hypothetical protein RMJ83_09125 [Armatimonadota bacterium]|nr:hypothetical protein [Armatimonadota bacterium]
MHRPNPRRGFDEAWKYAMRTFFREGLQLLFPAVHDAIEWEHPVEFIDTEFYRLAPKVRAQRRQSADIVAKARFLDGTERFVLIHIEIQAQTRSKLSPMNVRVPLISTTLMSTPR